MNVLVITDNIFIYESIKGIIINTEFSEVVTYACSEKNSPLKEHLDYNSNIFEIDVKKNTHQIINTYELVISAHCKQIFPKLLVDSVRCINIHPGYLPLNRGWYPQVFSIIYDLDIGATIHEMDEKLDNGPVIVRKKVEKKIIDTSLSLYNRVVKAELDLFRENLCGIINNTYQIIDTSGEQTYFFDKNDFNDLCEININEKGNVLKFYNKLRALTHPPYNNAYFIDEKTEERVLISINMFYE